MSNLTAFNYIGERSEATPGLWNAIFSQLSENIATLDFTSGGTTSISSNLSVGLDLWVKGQVISGQDASITTRTLLSLGTNSNVADYIHFSDTSNSRSNYILGSHVGGTADGWNLWDDSAGTMIFSMSKQSIRFYQNVVGPVFDVGGALADTYNAATFGTGADSNESRIQAAISQASIDGVARVYLPANMYPYSAGSISFHTAVQMVREGGNWAVYDARAYGATGDGTTDDYDELQSCTSAAAANKGIAFLSAGSYSLSSSLKLDNNATLVMERNAVLLRNFSGGAAVNATIRNRDIVTSGNSNIAIVGGDIRNRNANTGKHVSMIGVTNFLLEDTQFSGISGDWNTSLLVYDAIIRNIKMDSGRTSGEDGLHIHGGRSILIENCNIVCGDDAIALNSDDPNVGLFQSGVDNIHDVTIANCVASSTTASMLRISVASNNTRQIYNVNVNGLTGFGRTLNLGNYNVSLTSQVRDIKVSNVLSDMSGQGGVASTVTNMESVKLNNITVLYPQSRGFHITGVRNASFIGCSTISNRAASVQGFLIQDTFDSVFVDCSAVSTTQHGFAVGGASGSTCSWLAFIGCSAYSCLNAGIQLDNAQQCLVTNFISRNNGTAIGEGSASSGNVWMGIQSLGNAGGIGTISGGTSVFFGLLGQGAHQGVRTLSGTAIQPAYAFTSERSLGWYRSATSVMALSYGTLVNPGGASFGTTQSSVGSATLFVVQGTRANVHYDTFSTAIMESPEGRLQLIGDDGGTFNTELILTAAPSTGSNKHWILHHRAAGQNYLELGFSRSSTSGNVGGTIDVKALSFRTTGELDVHNAIWFPSGSAIAPTSTFSSERSLGWFRSATSTMALSYGTLLINGPVWSSGISVGGGTLIPQISSMSSLVGAFVVQPSSSSFTGIAWAAVGIGDIILCAPFQSGAASSISSGLVPHSLVTVAGQIEFRLSNVSTLVQNQSAQTWVFTRIRPF